MAKQTIHIIDENTVKITLSKPIIRGNVTHETIEIKSPTAGHTMGMAQDLLKVKHTESMQKLITKITTPNITKKEYMDLSLSDAQLFNLAIDFFSVMGTARDEMMESLSEMGLLAGASDLQNSAS